ncbi:MAG: hypothetical protein ABIJ04_10755 [Bacteroidota bacterium]
MHRIILFIASLTVAYAFVQPVSTPYPEHPMPPDTTYSSQTPSSDSAYQKLLILIAGLFDQQRYEECLVELKKANALKPGVPSIQERIIRVEGLIAQQKKIQAEYTRLITMADEYFGKADYLNAKASYQMAIDIKPDDAHARESLNRTMERLRSQKAQNILYDVTVASADKLFHAGEYEKAKREYENAGRILPREAYPKEKINAIIKIQVDQQVREELYQGAISAADRYYNSRSYQRALLEYQKALQQKPAEPYPQERINELATILAELAALEKAYNEAVSRADQLFSEIRYADARNGYEEALALKPNESYPAEKIRQIDRILEGIAKTNADFDRFINLADSFYIAKNFIRARQNYQLALQVKPNESYPKAMMAKTTAGVSEQQANELVMEEAYHAAITNADKLFSEKALVESKVEYMNAMTFKPEEKYPQQRISEIDELLAAALARQQQIDTQYSRVLANADRLFSDNLYAQSREQYEAALKLKQAEAYPVQKIEEIDRILADLEQQLEIDTRYKAVLKEATTLFTAGSYDPAKAEYRKALVIKPAEALPRERIRQIDSILIALASKQLLESRFDSLIASGDRLFKVSDYTSARDDYKEASALKPQESYPATKLNEIDGILAEIARITALEAQYAQAVARGDSLLSAELLPAAKREFENAAGLKPTEEYPKTKLAEIDVELQEAARLLALDKRYQEEVATGDRLFADKSWDPAIAAYQRAQELKTSEKYPTQKIQQIDSIRQEIDRQLQIDREYRTIITHADQLFSVRSLDSARVKFARAGELRPAKSYWQEQIMEIDRIQAEIRRRNEEYQAAISMADGLLTGQQYEPAREAYQHASLIKTGEAYPREKIKEINQILAEIQGRRQTFDKLVANGDQFLAFREYVKARENFQQALELFPGEVYPKEQLRLTNVRIDSIYRANKADYDKAVGEGDGFFNTYEYDKAIDAYTRAIVFLSMEDYPRKRIAMIRKTISENAIADVLSMPVTIKAGEEQKFPFKPVNIASRRNNFIYLKVKNLSDNNFNVLMRYGKEDQISGGLAIRNVSADGEVNERLISVKDQDPWYREDNNWISLYPQGGDIEVSFIQVSRAIK